MSNRNFPLAILVCLASSVAAFGAATPGQELLFQFFSQPNSSTLFSGYIDSGNLATPLVSSNGPAGIAAIIPSPKTGGFYLIGLQSPTSVQASDSTLTNFTTLNGLGAAPTAAAVTPDGNYLLVAADALYIFDTSNNALLTPGGLQVAGAAAFNPSDVQTGPCVTCWIVVSQDSQNAFVLTNSPFSSTVTQYSLATRTKVGSINLNSEASSITLSPLGMLYITIEFRIYVIDPATFIDNAANDIGIGFEPGPLRFTPDGSTAYVVNRFAKGGGGSMAQINLATGQVVTWPPSSPEAPAQLDDIFVASNNRVFTFSSGLNQLLDVSTSPFQASPVTSLTLPTNVVQNEILAVAISSELPQAQWLFLLVANGNQTDLYRVSLSTNALDSNTLSTFNTGAFETTYVPAQTGATQFLQYNNNQSLPNGGTSKALLAKVLDAGGIPVFGQSVTFTTDPSNGLVINSPSPTTNTRGSVSSTVTVPTTGASCPQGVCTITLTAGSATTTFTVTVPSSSGTGTGPGGTTSSQVQIYSGDGQLLQSGTGIGGNGAVADPLVVLVTDANGKPLPNVPVSFSASAGAGASGNTTQFIGGIDVTAAVNTNANGLASVDFVSEGLPQGAGFQTTIVTAATSLGSVNFTIVEYAEDFGGGGAPQVLLLAPQGGPIQITEGTPFPGAIQATILSTAQIATGTPIPGVGIFVVDPDNPTNDPNGVQPVAACQGSSNSNSQGIASCTLVAKTCKTELHGITIYVGNLYSFQAEVQTNPGGASTISILSGNNQSGQAGTAAALPLTVQVIDPCGNPVAGSAVTWKVTGSATLSQTNLITSPSGQVSTNVTFGQTAGPVTVTATLSTGASVVFKLTTVVSVSAIKLITGNSQTATTGQQFAAPVVFQVTDKNGNPLSGIQVTFAVQSGSATVTPASVATNTAGQAQASVTAGATAGPIVIAATASGLTATANLTAVPPGPTLTAGSFQNAASFAPGLTPCGLGVVVGAGLAPGVSGVITGPAFGPAAYTLGPINSLIIGGVPAPISSVSNENNIQQVTFQTPCEVAPGVAAAVTITVNSVPATINGVQILASQPGVFTYPGPNGIAYGAVIRALDGTYVTPSNLANRGETYYIVVTGLGQTTPLASTDNPGNGQQVNAEVIAGVNNAGVGTGIPTYASGLIGVYLVPFQIPLTAATGTNLPLAVATINGQSVTFSNPSFIPGVK